MNKNILTVLGCSSSITLALLTNNSANANTIKDYTFAAPNITEAEMVEISKIENNLNDCTCSNYNSNIYMNDALGDLAIAQRGCDCAGCRYITLSQVQQGELQLPQ